MVGELQYLYRTREAELQKQRDLNAKIKNEYSAGSILSSFKNKLGSNSNSEPNP